MNYEIKEKLDKKLRELAKRDKVLHIAIQKKITKILENPYLGKPLRNILKGKRRVHVGHFVLIYEIDGEALKIVFLNFEHHDKAYK